jgi:hypothetical protein
MMQPEHILIYFACFWLLLSVRLNINSPSIYALNTCARKDFTYKCLFRKYKNIQKNQYKTG